MRSELSADATAGALDEPGAPGEPTERLRADATAVLHAYDAQSREQALLRLDFLAHLAAHRGAVLKAGPPAHLTASCLVLDESLERVLLTLHRKAGAWFQFGGHLEAGDRGVRAAAQREAREESGIESLRVTPALVDLDRHRLVGDFGSCEEHLDIRYAATVRDDTRPRVSAESLDVRWWPVNALPETCADELTGLGRLVGAARAALGAQ